MLLRTAGILCLSLNLCQFCVKGASNDLYVVLLHDHVSPSVAQRHLQIVRDLSKAHSDHNIHENYTINHNIGLTQPQAQFKSYWGRLQDDVVKNIRDSPYVAYVELDSGISSHFSHGSPVLESKLSQNIDKNVQTQFSTFSVNSERMPAQTAVSMMSSTRSNVSQASNLTRVRSRPGLARLSHIKINTSSEYTFFDRAGLDERAQIYSFDSGVRLSHTEFEHRVTSGADFTRVNTSVDDFGHGTHVMGIMLGRTFGVARHARGISVKTLDKNGYGTVSQIIQGLDWVLHQPGDHNRKIINLSFGGHRNAVLDNIVERVVKAGIHIVVSAGNERADVAAFSPASSNGVITVGAIDDRDRAACYSNYGTNIEFVAPGNDVLSASSLSDVAQAYKTGTSMAAPHVAGVIAYLIDLYGPMSPELMRMKLRRLAQVHATGFPNSTLARIIYNGSGL